jgi:hypothetical protein
VTAEAPLNPGQLALEKTWDMYHIAVVSSTFITHNGREVQDHSFHLQGLALTVMLQSHRASRHCSKIAEAEAVVSVNEKKLLEMHMYMHVQLMQ